MNGVKVTVFSASDMFVKETEIGQLTSLRIIENAKALGKFSLWANATKENLDALIHQPLADTPRVIGFKLNSAPSGRNFVLGTGSAFTANTASGVVGAWPVSSDGPLQLSGKKVTFSAKVVSGAPVTGTECKVKFTYKHLPDSITLTNGELVLDLLSVVDTTAKRVFVTARLPDIGLSQLAVTASFVGLSGSVTVSEAKLELGDTVTTWEAAPEDTGSLHAIDMLSGIIERVALEDNNNFRGLVVEGYLLEKVLDYRCIWKLFTYSGTLAGLCQAAITQNAISPTLSERALQNLQISIPSALTSYSVDTQKTGGSLSDYLYSVTGSTRYGLQLVHDYIVGKIRIYLYEGKDRTASQTDRPSVVFTRKNGLLIAPQYERNVYDYRNVALVAGAGEGVERSYLTLGSATGWSRKEVYIDARDLQKKNDEGVDIPEEDYLAQLAQRGNEKLAAYSVVENFTSDVNPEGYVYNKDYFLNDVVTLYDDLYNLRLDAPIESVETVYTASRVTRKLQFGAGQLSLNQRLKLKLN